MKARAAVRALRAGVLAAPGSVVADVLLVCVASGPQQGITMDKVQLEPRFFKGVLQVRSSRAAPAPHAPPLPVRARAAEDDTAMLNPRRTARRVGTRRPSSTSTSTATCQ